MRKIILMFTLLFINTLVYGQEKKVKNEKKEKYQKIKIIEWDYLTSTYVKDSIFKNLKVNDILQIRLLNLPQKFKLTSNATFSNNHLEGGSSFSNLIEFSKDNNYNKNTLTKSTENSTKELIKNNTKEVDKNSDIKVDSFIKMNEEVKNEINNLSQKDREDIKKLLNKKTKISDSTLIRDLEINIAEQYIKSKKDVESKKALIDIKWQKHLISIAQENWKRQLFFRDSLLIDYSSKIDTLNSKLNLQLKENNKLSKRGYYYSTPIKIENFDYTQIKFNITDSNTNDESELNINFRNLQGFKVDFSTGILFNGLFSPTYKIIENPVNNTKKIVEEANNSSKFNSGICLLAHAYTRTGEFVNFGISSGFSYNLNQQNLNFLLGGSFLWGSEQRFITTFGLNVGKVKELSSYYKINYEYDSTEFASNAEPPTVELLKASWFLSISYNLNINKSTKTIKL